MVGRTKALIESVNVVPRTLLTIVVLEIGSTLAVAMLWFGPLAVSDARVAVPFFVARSVISIAYLAHLLAPVRAFLRQQEEQGQPGDALVFEADAALQRVFPRLAMMVAASWFVSLTLSLLLPALGVPSRLPLADADLAMAALMMVAVLLGVPLLLYNPLRSGLHRAQLEVSRVILERDLEPRRERSSIATTLATYNSSSIFVMLLVGGSVAGLLRIRGIRAETLAHQLRHAELAAVRPRAPLEPGVTIVGVAELPAILDADPHAEAGETLAVFEAARERVVAAAAIGDGRWALAQAEPDEQLGLTVGFLALFCGLALGPIIITGVAMGRGVTEPIEELDATARQVIEIGRLGRIARIPALRNDEVGSLATTFNLMLDAFEELALAASAVIEGDLRVEIDRPGDLPDAFRAMLGHLHEMVQRIRETTLELASAASELLAATEAQSVAAEQQSASVQQVSELTRSLAESATQITTAAAAVRDNAEQSVATATTTVARIEEFNGQTHGIRELLGLIHEVADRSDLLALNGSLEAVRAGEAGRGFGLVATEMRRLAERVGGAVNDIRERVTNIETSASSTVGATQHSRELAQSTAEATRSINDAIGQQSEKTKEAAAVARQVAMAVSAFATATAQTRSTAEGLRAYAEQLEHMTRSFKL